MERRDWSIKALEEFKYIDSQEDVNLKANLIKGWVEKYLTNGSAIEDFELDIDQLNTLSEIFFKNINFLKTHSKNLKSKIDEQDKIKEFLT